MIKIKLLVATLLLLSLAHAQASCAPFGARIQYGDILLSQASKQKAVISFNTVQQCASSYVRLLAASGFKDVSCQSFQVTGSAKMNFFTTYIQRCSLTNQISFESTFEYIVYGWDLTTGEDAVPGTQNWVSIKLINPYALDVRTNVLVLADWGVIKKSGFTPIAQSLRAIMAQRELNLLLVNGDIAYDLESNNGTSYAQFLADAEEFISQIPCIFVPGNHQSRSPDSSLLLYSTFKSYNLDTQLATGLTFGNLYFVPFDPYKLVYGQNQTINSLQALQAQLAIAKTKQLFIVPSSHYPLTCSGQRNQCLSQLAKLYPYFNAMIDAGATLYIGAHTHDYERIYPYFPNQTFQTLESPYSEGKGYLISIVEGVAGSDTTLITDMTTLISNQTASYTTSQTGFGILSVDPTTMQVGYQHYSTKQGLTDQIAISLSLTRVNKVKLLSKRLRKIANLARNQND